MTSAKVPEQIETDEPATTLASGRGLMVTVCMVGRTAEQPLAVGMMLNSTSMGAKVELEIISWISPFPKELVIVIPAGTNGTDQA